jgi:hypothetical protein
MEPNEMSYWNEKLQLTEDTAPFSLFIPLLLFPPRLAFLANLLSSSGIFELWGITKAIVQHGLWVTTTSGPAYTFDSLPDT